MLARLQRTGMQDEVGDERLEARRVDAYDLSTSIGELEIPEQTDMKDWRRHPTSFQLQLDEFDLSLTRKLRQLIIIQLLQDL